MKILSVISVSRVVRTLFPDSRKVPNLVFPVAEPQRKTREDHGDYVKLLADNEALRLSLAQRLTAQENVLIARSYVLKVVPKYFTAHINGRNKREGNN